MKLRLLSLFAVVIGMVAGGFALADTKSGDRRSANSSPVASQSSCPRGTTALPADAVAGAARAALAAAPRLYPANKRRGMKVTQASLAVYDRQRGAYARSKCGRRVQRRTVVVYLDFPAMGPSASLRQGVLLVTKRTRHYRVWTKLH
jgi:hypothetical protein